MRRRLVILIGSFLLILLAAMVVKWFSDIGGNYESERAAPDTIADSNLGLAGDAPTGRASADRGSELRLYGKDAQTRRITSVIVLPVWRKRDDGSYVAKNPCIEYRLDNGQRVYITADAAVMRIEEVAGSARIIDGRAYSPEADNPRSVRIYLDRANDVERPSFTDLSSELSINDVFAQLDQRREDMVRIFLEDISYDHDEKLISTEREILLRSAEADISGDAFAMQWNERPSELLWLKMPRGGTIHWYDIPPEVNLIAMPGEEEAAVMPEDDQKGAADVASADSEDFALDDLAAAPDVVRSAETDQVAPSVAAPGAAAGPLEPTGDAAQNNEDENKQNIFLAEFQDSVIVESGARRMWGADKLSIKFEWGRQADERLRQRLANGKEDDRAGEGQGGEGDAMPDTDSAMATQLSDNERPPGTATDAAGDGLAESGEPVVITWKGQLLTEPVGWTPTPSSRRIVVTAVGKNVHLEDPQATASCRLAVFNHPQRTGDLRGDGETPTTVYLAGGQEIISSEIHFDLPNGKVLMNGPGMITQTGQAEKSGEQAAEVDLPQLGAISDAGTISWQERAEATFGTQRVVRDDGTIEQRQYIEDAVFLKDVILTQGPPTKPVTEAAHPRETTVEADVVEGNLPEGEFLRCDIMRVWMKDQDGQKVAPESAVAKGNVIASQQGSLIRAGRVTVFFDEVEEIDEDQVVTRLKATEVHAINDVTVTDARNPTQPVEARADRIQSYLLDREAILFGRDRNAEIVQGDRRLAGMEIRLDQDAQSAEVVGPGEMRLFTDQDMDGNPLSAPREVDITWQERMEYSGKTNDANFIGDVELTSQQEYMSCRQLRVLFKKDSAAESEQADAAGLAAQDSAGDQQLGLNIERYSDRRLSVIMAFNDVVVRSRRENDSGQLTGRMQMTGQRLMYDLLAKELSVFGDGTLVAEDYQAPTEDGKPRTRTDAAGSATLQSPSQTAFLWTREMQLLQLPRQVKLKGNVEMIHRSGDQVVVMPGMNVPEWEQLDSGRKSSMRCEELFAEFAPPSDMSEQEMAVSGDMWESGPRLGPLELFTAYRKVNMTDGPIQIIGEQLDYDRRHGSAVVLGFLENEPRRDASLIYKNQQTGESQSWSSPKMTIDIRDGQISKVYTETVTGAGGVRARE